MKVLTVLAKALYCIEAVSERGTMIHLQTEYDYALVFVDKGIRFSYGSCGQFDPIEFGGARCAIDQYGRVCYPDDLPGISNLEIIAKAMVGKVKLWDGGSYLTKDLGYKTEFIGFPSHA